MYICIYNILNIYLYFLFFLPSASPSKRVLTYTLVKFCSFCYLFLHLCLSHPFPDITIPLFSHSLKSNHQIHLSQPSCLSRSEKAGILCMFHFSTIKKYFKINEDREGVHE